MPRIVFDDQQEEEVGALPPQPTDLHSRVPMGEPSQQPAAPQIVFEDEAPQPQGMEFAGFALPEGVSQTLQPVMDFSRGFNEMLATTVGAPVELVDQALGALGGEGFLDQPGDAISALQDAFKRVGVEADTSEAVSELSADIGKSTFQNAVILGALFAAAPTMAGAAGETLLPSLQRTFGQELMRRPGLAAATEATATVGGEVGEDMGGPLGGIAGSVVGGGLGAAATQLPAAARASVSGALKGGGTLGAAGLTLASPELGLGGAILGGTGGTLRGMWKTLRAPDLDVPADALARSNLGDLDNARNYAQFAIEGDKVKTENAIKAAVNRVRVEGDPLKAAERLRGGLQKAYTQARRKETGLWHKVKGSLTVDAAPLKGFAQRMTRLHSKLAPKSLPREYIARINSITKNRYLRDPQTGKRRVVKTSDTTVKDLRALRGEILAEMRDPEKSDELRRNLGLLQNEILKVIKDQYPDNKQLQEAMEFSGWLHNRFTRGPIGQLLERSSGARSGGFRKDPGKAAQALLNRERAGADIADVGRRLNRPSLEQQSASYIRNRFREAANEMGPEAGQKFLRRPETRRFMENFPSVDAEMDIVARDLDEFIGQQEVIKNSALIRFMDEDPQTAIQSLFSGKNKVSRTREIVGRLSENEEAIDAFRTGMLDQLFRAGRESPEQIQTLLQAKDLRNVFREAFTSEQFARLERMLRAGVDIEQGRNVGTGQRIAQRSSRLISRVWGAQLGRLIARTMGGGTVQTPGIFASAAGNSVDNLMRAVPANTLLARAILDPKWERALLSKIPENLKEVRRTAKLLRGLITTQATATEAIEGQIEQ